MNCHMAKINENIEYGPPRTYLLDNLALHWSCYPN